MKTESEKLESPRGILFYVKDNLKKNYILYLSFFIFAFFYLITRVPYLLFDAAINLTNDYQNYYMIVDQINKGFFPTFTIRTPGYPLFLTLLFMFFRSNMAVVVVQNILSLAAPLFFIFAIHAVFKKNFRFMPVLASIGMGVFVSLPIHLRHDFTLLTESLYINSIIFFFGLLIMALYKKTKFYWICCGLSMSNVILVRPAGIFLVAVFAILVLFLLIQSAKKTIILFFALSFIGPLFLMCVYSYFTIGTFSVSTFSEHALISFTSTFLEESPDYPPQLNKAIRRSQKRIKKTPPKKKKSVSSEQLRRHLYRGYNRNRIIIFRTLTSFEDKNEDNLYLKWRPMLRRAALDAIGKHPRIYLKYLFVNLSAYFFQEKKIDFYPWTKAYRQKIPPKKSPKTGKKYSGSFSAKSKDSLRLYYKNEFIKTLDSQFFKDLLKEYWSPRGLAREKISKLKKWNGKLHILQKVQKGFFHIHQFLFQNLFWVFFFFAAFIFGFFRTLFTRFRHRGSIFMFILTLSALLHGVVISMSSVPDDRLSYPLDFIYYLSVFLFPILFVRDDNRELETGKSEE